MFGISKLIGGSAPKVRDVTPTRASLPGLEMTRSGREFTFQRTADVTGVLGDIRSMRTDQAGQLRDLAAEVRPGFGRLTEARVGALGANRQRTLGGLREQLQRRRVLGSSFGADVQARAEAEFAMQEDQIRAESFLQELDATTQLLNQAFEAEIQGIMPELQQLGLEQQVAASLISGLTQTSQNAQIAQAQLANAALDRQAGFFGSLIGAGTAYAILR